LLPSARAKLRHLLAGTQHDELGQLDAFAA
jgi:hypothetical protein